MAAVSDSSVVIVLEHIVLVEKIEPRSLSVHLSCSAPIVFEMKNKAERDTFFNDVVTALKATP